jgi:hypothetical protein
MVPLCTEKALRFSARLTDLLGSPQIEPEPLPRVCKEPGRREIEPPGRCVELHNCPIVFLGVASKTERQGAPEEAKALRAACR